MNRRRLFWATIVGLLAAPIGANAQPIPAFPGAEGAGARATGGRPIEKLNFKTGLATPTVEKRGVVYHVTTLAPDPAGTTQGSLMYGLKNENWWYSTHPTAALDIDQPDSFDVTPRIIVFDVGGTIDFSQLPANERDIDITPMNFTIAGHTAPGGITILGAEFNPGHRDNWDGPFRYPPKTNNFVLRNFSIRTNNPSEKDALWIPATNSIADHMSMSWYTDEGASITDSARNITLQHSIIGPGWNNPDGDGSQIEGKTPMADISVHHNLYIHNDARIPRVGEKTATTGGPGVELDFRNNVIYNWNDSRAGYGVSGENSFSNFVSNYYIGGAGTSSTVILNVPTGSAGQTHRVYQNGNLMDQNKNSAADGTDLGWPAFTGNEAQQSTPYLVPHGVTQTPAGALDTVRQYAGADWWDRDFLDQRAIDQLMTFGNSALPVSQRGQVLSSIDPADVAAVVNAPLQTRPANWDSDNDGMPDDWEEEHGLDAHSPGATPDWKLDYDSDGYINVEEYINEIAEWPAPFEIIFGGGTNNRYAQITNWEIQQDSPGEADTITNWQPTRFDIALINNSTVTVDAVGQHAGALFLGGNSGNNAVLNITSGWLKVEDESVGPGNGELTIGLNPTANAVLNLTGGELYVKTLSKGTGGSLNFTGGVLHAETVNFDLVNNGGTIAPGHSPGLMHVVGDLTLSTGTLEIEIGGTGIGEFDRVLVDGVTMLGGTLKVDLVDLGGGEFVPELGDQFAFLASAGGTGGMFDGFDLPQLTDGLAWAILPGDVATFLAVVEAAVGLAGDYNGDQLVNAADYTVWRNNFGGTALPFNETASLGTVDEADYQAWKDNFGASSSSGSAAGNSAVPEPSSVVLLLVGLAGFICRSAKRSALATRR